MPVKGGSCSGLHEYVITEKMIISIQIRIQCFFYSPTKNYNPQLKTVEFSSPEVKFTSGLY